jgi:hypothetical protein
MNWLARHVGEAEEEHRQERDRHDADQEIGEGQSQRQAPDDRSEGGRDPERQENHSRVEGQGRGHGPKASQVAADGLDDRRRGGGDRKEEQPALRGSLQGHGAEEDSIGPPATSGSLLRLQSGRT